MYSKIASGVLRLILLGVFFLLLYFPDQVGITFQYAMAPLADSLFLRICKTVLLIFISLELLRCFYYIVIKGRSKGWLSNLLTVLFPLVWILIILEMIFMFVPQSHEGVLSKASQIWWAKYWKPVNSLGYRDEEPAPEAMKKQILVIGDSFTAGHGLKKVSDRFSNRLAEMLGDSYQVYNLGVSGSDTGDEANRLLNYPVAPDKIIIQYFPNDIGRVAQAQGLTITGGQPYEDIGGFVNQLVQRFYLPNFIYWQLPHVQFSTFDQFVSAAYSDSTVLKHHFNDLEKIIAYGDSTGAEIYTVFIPFLFQLVKSENYTKPVKDYLTKRGVNVVTLTEEIANIPEKRRVVGRNDGHASARVNEVVAEKLFNMIQKNDITISRK